MFENLFKRMSSRPTPKEKINESLLALQDSLANHEIVTYIRNRIAYIENSSDSINYFVRRSKLRIEGDNGTIKIDAYPSFSELQELIVTCVETTEMRSYKALRGINFNEEYIFTTDIRESTFRNGNRYTIKRNREDRSYLNDSIIYRCKLKEIEEEVRDQHFCWQDHAVYFLDGVRGIKRVFKSAPKFNGDLIVHPDIDTGPYFVYSEVFDVEQMSFYDHKNWTEPFSSPISLETYKDKLKKFEVALNKDKAHELFLETLAGEEHNCS